MKNQKKKLNKMTITELTKKQQNKVLGGKTYRCPVLASYVRPSVDPNSQCVCW